MPRDSNRVARATKGSVKRDPCLDQTREHKTSLESSLAPTHLTCIGVLNHYSPHESGNYACGVRRRLTLAGRLSSLPAASSAFHEEGADSERQCCANVPLEARW